MNFKPIETLPWELDRDYDPPLKMMPVGVILKHNAGAEHLIGYDVGGQMTRGCSCCAMPWWTEIRHYAGWAWAPGMEPLEMCSEICSVAEYYLGREEEI